MPVQSHRVWIGDPSVVRFHWSRRLTRDHLSIVSLHYIFDSNMSTALARSRHKKHSLNTPVTSKGVSVSRPSSGQCVFSPRALAQFIPLFRVLVLHWIFMPRPIYSVCLFWPLSGILQGVFWGLGNGGGTMLSGVIYHHYGGVTTFHVFAVMGMAVFLFLFIANYVITKIEKRSQSKEGYEALSKDSDPTNWQV